MVCHHKLGGGGQNFCKALSGKTLFSALYGTHTVALLELKAVHKVSIPAGLSKTPKSGAEGEAITENAQD
jgi:hypothetical protein